jgi:hypothetical protein
MFFFLEMMEKFDKNDTNTDKQKQRPLIRVEDNEVVEPKSGCC